MYNIAEALYDWYTEYSLGNWYTEYFGGIRQLVHRIQYCSGIIQLVYRPQHQSDEAGEVMWRKRMKGLYVEAGAWYRPI